MYPVGASRRHVAHNPHQAGDKCVGLGVDLHTTGAQIAQRIARGSLGRIRHGVRSACPQALQQQHLLDTLRIEFGRKQPRTQRRHPIRPSRQPILQPIAGTAQRSQHVRLKTLGVAHQLEHHGVDDLCAQPTPNPDQGEQRGDTDAVTLLQAEHTGAHLGALVPGADRRPGLVPLPAVPIHTRPPPDGVRRGRLPDDQRMLPCGLALSGPLADA